MSKLLFFTSCDGQHNQFILPYIFFAILYNPNSCFEIVTDGFNDYNILYGCNYISQLFKCPILIRRKQYDLSARYLRFLTQPCLSSQYCYIGDIDILLFENILPFHLNKLQQYNTIIDNQIRLTDQSRFTGLHFCEFKYFELVKNVQLKYLNKDKKELLKMNDEALLLNICKESGLYIPPVSENIEQFNLNRPIHGIHFSLNRKPFKSDSKMSFTCNTIFKQKLLDVINNSKEFKGLKQYIDENFLKNLNIALNFCK